MEKPSDVEYVSSIISGIISNQKELRVERTIDEMGVLITVSVSRSDMGRVIGKEGSTAKAIRTLANAYGYSANEKIHVKILEPII